jgi:glycosyltransferase involved in cell wall biosynthesis
MRILHVVGGLNRGGAETWLVQVLRNIDRKKYQFDFLVHTEDPGAYDDEVRALGARIIPCLAPGNPLRYSLNFLRILREAGPYDCVHSHVHLFSGFVLFLARLHGVKMRICQAHTSYAEMGKGVSRRFYATFMTFLVRSCATHGIAVSKFAADSFFPKYWRQSKKWQICLIGVDVSRFSAPANKADVRSELGIPQEAVVVGHVGRFVVAKNHGFLLDVARHLVRKKPNARFLFIGDGPLFGEFSEKIAEHDLQGYFHLTGSRDDVPKLLAAMDVFVFPSLYEGFGISVLEAQLAGVPCLVADTVPEEACLSPKYVQRLNLSDGAENWAITLLSMLSESAPLVVPQILEFSIEQSVKRLIRIYDER